MPCRFNFWKEGSAIPVHEFDPVYDSESKILILGSFPSEASREQGFYYGHHRNRFWRVLAAVLGQSMPVTIDDKRAMLLRSRIALWDAAASCDVTGSSDASIRNVVPNNIGSLLENTSVCAVFANGTTAAKIYRKYILPIVGLDVIVLPSTSPANAACSEADLVESWKIILDYLN